jgi:hypothetical protein
MRLKRKQQSTKSGERRWAENLQEQAKNWQLAKPDGHYLTKQGVPVVRRHKRSSIEKESVA